MPTFYFGSDTSSGFCVSAPTLKRAIMMFRVGCPYPHSYSTAPIVESENKVYGEYRVRRTDNDEPPIALRSGPDAVVRVFERKPDGQREEVAQIPVEVDDSEAFTPQMLAQAGIPSEVLETETQISTTSNKNALQLSGHNRTQLEEKHLALQHAMSALAAQKKLLEEQARQLREELKQRMDQVWFIELFLGSKEEVVQLASGKPADVSERITIYQRVLCMDEEIAVTDMDENPDKVGSFDIQRLEDFDNWLTSSKAHLNAVCPASKGVVALRVRRKTKRRDAEDFRQILHNAALAEADAYTYLLVRNGENLYRLWVDVTIWPRLIPRTEDINRVNADNVFEKEQKKDALKHYAAGMLVINGLLQRSDVLHPLPNANMNVFLSSDVDAYFTVVFDDEGKNLLGDGRDFEHLTWTSYHRWLQEKLSEGVRVFWIGEVDWREDKLFERTGMASVRAWPKMGEAYTVNAVLSRPWKRYVFRYLPADEVATGSWSRGVFRPRKNKVSFSAFNDELIPVDYVSWRVLDHLIRDRGQREHYGRFYKLAGKIRKLVLLEARREKPFIDLVLVRCGVSLTNEKERARCERLLRWWKLKTKEHRTISKDEGKALRMVTDAFARGDDVDDDPEKDLRVRRGTADE